MTSRALGRISTLSLVVVLLEGSIGFAAPQARIPPPPQQTVQPKPSEDATVAAVVRGAEQGNAAAQFNLGAMYGVGQGVPHDYVEAHKWHSLAAARASADTQKEYAITRDALAKLMTPEQIAEAQKRASEWLAAFEKRTKQ